MIDRVKSLVDGYDLSRGTVEIAPLCSPVIQKNLGFPVVYIDHLSYTDLKQKYASDPNVRLEDICDVDIVWPGTGPLDLGEFSAHLCVASHVIEHIPDPVRWLRTLLASLPPGGEISLAIPDKRYTFDVRRQNTRPDEILSAYIERRQKPSVSQIIGHGLYYSHSTAQQLWNGEFDPTPVMNEARAKWAFELARDTYKSGEYRDVHCWVWTPESFYDCMIVARKAGVLPAEIVHLSGTAPGDIEFFARLRSI